MKFSHFNGTFICEILLTWHSQNTAILPLTWSKFLTKASMQLCRDEKSESLPQLFIALRIKKKSLKCCDSQTYKFDGNSWPLCSATTYWPIYFHLLNQLSWGASPWSCCHLLAFGSKTYITQLLQIWTIQWY